MGGSSPWTRPSAPECGETLKALESSARPGVGIVIEDGSRVAVDWVTVRSREADVPVGRAALTAHFGRKSDRPWMRLERMVSR